MSKQTMSHRLRMFWIVMTATWLSLLALAPVGLMAGWIAGDDNQLSVLRFAAMMGGFAMGSGVQLLRDHHNGLGVGFMVSGLAVANGNSLSMGAGLFVGVLSLALLFLSSLLATTLSGSET